MEVLYEHSDLVHNTRAATQVVPFLMKLYNPKSILDVGCGIGTWLKIFQDSGVHDILGIDGEYVDRGKLQIADTFFKPCDLRDEFLLGRKFDLALCLEVGEHLPASSATSLVDSLTAHSDNIVFSAAIPGQGGQNHINEQWPDYWKKLFEKRGLVRLDLIRPHIWDDQKVDIWYRQNIYLFTKHHSPDVAQPGRLNAEIHPDLWQMKVDKLEYVQKRLKDYETGDISFFKLAKLVARVVRRKLTGI